MRAYVKKVESTFLGRGEMRWRCQVKDGKMIVTQFFVPTFEGVWVYLDNLAKDIKNMMETFDREK